MNKIESIIYGAVRKHPGIKKIIKTIYQGFFDLLPRQKEILDVSFQSKEGYFFGFHDISQFSIDESKILANKTPFDGRMPNKGEHMEIGYFDFKDGSIGDYHKLADTYAWNYHKGCRLQWIDQERVIFNTAKDGKLISQEININTGECKYYNYPIDSIYKDSEQLLATNFSYERLNKCMPGYGYPVLDGDSIENAPSDSGLFLLNLHTRERKLAVSLSYLKKNYGKDYPEYTHFVTHTEFSKDGRYVAFLYRTVPKGGEGKDMHNTWIMIYDVVNEIVSALPTQMSGSHYVWNDKNQIIASCIIDGKSCHVLYDVANFGDYKIIAADKVNSDGHQTWYSNTEFVTDTYPDRRRMAKLYKINVKSEEVELIASLYSPKSFQTKDLHCHIACDLHPRLSPSGKYLTFDSPRTGKRAFYVMKLQ